MSNWTQREIRYLKDCYGILSVGQIAEHLGRSVGTVSVHASRLGLTRRERPNTSICWDCANAVNGCSWSRSFEPVAGWVVENTKLRAISTRCNDVVSYRVLKCPEFQPDEPAERTT